ncbi:MAG: A/G-specific adenine glycosylase [Desulfobulbaceae bacterium]|nr:A/G-specific adenine glycosylase [Desulfobulbaceae bacterium]
MQRLRQQLLDWFAVNSRDLPWRVGYNPYQVWISEVMLQQTQMERGVAYFKRWMERFPDIAALAMADEEEVLLLWEGLGYYSRARNILKAAQMLRAEHGGKLPADHAALRKLPGIGPYTAGAIMSLAFNEPYPVVDANVERLFARLYDIAAPIKECRELLWQKARDLLPEGEARRFNQALMELGALVCKPKNPSCGLCPVSEHCRAHQKGIVDARPVLGKAQKIIPIASANGVLVSEGRFFIQKRRPQGVWANLWEFPGGQIESGESPEEAVVREFYEETGLVVGELEKIHAIKHTYTHYRITLHCYFVRLLNGTARPTLTAAQEYRWATPAELLTLAFPAPHRQLIEHLLADPASRAGNAS